MEARKAQGTHGDPVHFLHAFCDSIPCNECFLHMKFYLQEHPLTAWSDLEQWSFDFHNNVNERLGKPRFTREQFREAFKCSCRSNAAARAAKPLRASPGTNNGINSGVTTSVIAILGILVVAFFLLAAVAVHKGYRYAQENKQLRLGLGPKNSTSAPPGGP